MMRILVTGAKGQLGYDCLNELKRRGYNDILGIDKEDLDISNFERVMAFICDYKPDVVIHNAAYTAVDRAEEERDICYSVNALGPKYIALACKEIKAKMIYISTEYVFDGEKKGLYQVDDLKNPLGVYGMTKSLGEDYVRKTLDEYFIVRISWAFGVNGNNFIKTMLKLAKTRNFINVVCDQVGSPTYTFDLAKLLCDMMVTNNYGIYHASNEGFCSWYELAMFVFSQKGIKIDVKPISTAEYQKQVTQAKRPLNSCLDKSKIVEMGFQKLPSWQDAVNRYLNEIEE